MAKQLFRSLLFISLLGIFGACSTDEAARPLYIKLDKIHLQTDYQEEGSAHSNISTVWVYVNGTAAGAYELPALVPVIPKEGSNELKLYAGINTNGISSFRAINTSFEPIELSFDYENTGGAPDTLEIPESDLIVSYRSFFDVIIVEDFDDPGINFQRTVYSDTSFVKVDDPDSIFQFQPYGSNQLEPNTESGLIVLDNLNPQLDLVSVTGYDIPAGSQNIFLEVSYRSNTQIGFGLLADFPGGDQSDITAGVLPKGEWSKIYINLITEFQAFAGADAYHIIIRAKKPDNLSESRIFLDNIKLVYIPWKSRNYKVSSINFGMV